MKQLTVNRLTDRAKNVLLNVSEDVELLQKISRKKVSKQKIGILAKNVFTSILSSGGVGGVLLKNRLQIQFDAKKTVEIEILIERAFYYSALYKHLYVGTEHLLLALLDIVKAPELEEIKQSLQRINVFPNTVVALENEVQTPMLDAFGGNLNKKFSKYQTHDLVERPELYSLFSILLKKENGNAVLVGDSGVGKRTLIDLLVKKILNFDVPVALIDYQIVEFDALAFITNTSGREGFELAITALLEDLDKLGNVVLYVKDFQNLFIGTNSGIAVPFVFSMLKSYLATAGISVVGCMTPEFHARIQAENPQFLDGYETIDIDETNESTTTAILKSKVASLSNFHNITISNELLSYVYNKAKTNIKDINFPQKAISLLDHACAMLLLKKDLVPPVYKNMVEKKISLTETFNKKIANGLYDEALTVQKNLVKLNSKIELQREKLSNTKKLILTPSEVDESLLELGYEETKDTVAANLEQLRGLSTVIKKKIVGQDSAVETVSKALIRSKLGLRSKKRPLGNFLFLGPTGVGKTELAKVLSESVFDEKSLIRLDMSDFSEKHTAARLVGAPPGYVGYGEGGELTAKIDANPNSLVLFDEIEKAHPDVLNILLQIMEEGELSDARGNRFDFSKSIIVLTSNLGSEIVFKKEIGFVQNSKDVMIEDRLKDNLKKIMKPELINRFDEVVVFKKLGQAEQKRILELLLEEIDQTLKRQHVYVSVTANVKKEILRLGYSSEYGARGLRRFVEASLLDPIADYLLNSNKRPVKLKAVLSTKPLKDTKELKISLI